MHGPGSSAALGTSRRHRIPGRRRARLVGLSAVILVVAGCSSVSKLDVPVPVAATESGTTTTTIGPLPTVPEAPVSGSPPTTAVAMGPGLATINGDVLGPNGPVEGATVEVQRFVGDATATTQATTAADGSFSVPAILGGRYRVRAWQVPALADTTPQVFFLGGSVTKTLSLQLTSFSGLKVATDVNPSSPFTGQAVNLAVVVSQRSVGADGDVTQVPQPAVAVVLDAPNFTEIDGGIGTTATDASGHALFTLTCNADGPAPISLLVGGSTTVAVATPTCIDPDTTSTTSTTTVPPSTTTLVPPTSSTSSTTSTPTDTSPPTGSVPTRPTLPETTTTTALPPTTPDSSAASTTTTTTTP
jgi:hypothetical protein